MQGQHGRRRPPLLLLALVCQARQADGAQAAPLHTRLAPNPTPLPAPPMLSPNASLTLAQPVASASPPNATAVTAAATNATPTAVARQRSLPSTLLANLRRLLLFRVGWEAADAPAGATAALAAPANGTLSSERLADGSSELSSRLSLAARLEQAVPKAVPPQRGAHGESGEGTRPKAPVTTADVMNRPPAARCLRFDRAGGCTATVPMPQEEEGVVPPRARDEEERGQATASLSAAAALASQALAADFNAARITSYRTLRNGLAAMLIDFHNRSGSMPSPPGSLHPAGGAGYGGGTPGTPADLLPPLELAVAVLVVSMGLAAIVATVWVLLDFPYPGRAAAERRALALKRQAAERERRLMEEQRRREAAEREVRRTLPLTLPPLPLTPTPNPYPERLPLTPSPNPYP